MSGTGQLTFVDVMLFSLLEAINRELPLVLAGFPILNYFRAAIESLPSVSAFYNSRRY
jgi:hypothetical protein